MRLSKKKLDKILNESNELGISSGSYRFLSDIDVIKSHMSCIVRANDANGLIRIWLDYISLEKRDFIELSKIKGLELTTIIRDGKTLIHIAIPLM